MSHFVVLVQTDEDRPLDKLLEPFDENLEVEPYDVECRCIDRKARELATKEIHDGKTFDELKKEFKEKYDDGSMNKDELDKLWKKEVYNPWSERRDEIMENEKPEPKKDCSICEGTGIDERTYNPDSKWDWYAVGGRWDGYLGGENALKKKDIDPDKILRQERERAEDYHRDTLQDADEHDFHRQMSDYREGESAEDYAKRKIPDVWSALTPFAVLTKDGEWHQKAQMGWFGQTADEKEDEEWRKEFKQLFESFDDEDLIIVVDCHI